MNNTIFGKDVPTIPQWSGPPHTVVRVQAMLYTSLAASLLAAFLAMLGKQWLNRYISTGMQGTVMERSQNRQRKLDGIVTWYFDSVMELLPLMLQFALLLLGCALSLYISGVDTTVASVVIGITSLGAACYTFIIVAGTASVSCPYQTPGAKILRYLWQKVPNHSAFSITKVSVTQQPVTQYGPKQTLGQEATALDFPCISWILRTSLDQDINQLTLKFLASIITSPGFNGMVVMDCFNTLTNSIGITHNKVVILLGSEQLAEAAATCLLSTLSHLLVVDPKSDILGDVHQEFNRVLPPTTDLQDLPFRHTIKIVGGLFNGFEHLKGLSWEGVDLSTPDNIALAHSLVRVAWLYYQRPGGQKKVPRWILRFSLHCLLWSSNPPVSVIADSLSIVAIDLGCDIVDSFNKRYVHPTQPHSLSP